MVTREKRASGLMERAAVTDSDVRQSRREADVGVLTKEEKRSLVNGKELPPKYCRRTNTSSK